ncbi:hypothetical protein [Moorena sp. SIO4A5]|nr:hypothetical protein [Moorena sp. SIO4A5]
MEWSNSHYLPTKPFSKCDRFRFDTGKITHAKILNGFTIKSSR